MGGKRRTILLLVSYSAQSQTDYNVLSTQKDPAKVMYDKLKAKVAEIVKQSSNSIANWIRIELVISNSKINQQWMPLRNTSPSTV